MGDDLKKLTFRMDKASGESRTVIVIASTTVTGRMVRTMFDRSITVNAGETMQLVKEEFLPNPGIVGTKPEVVFVDDFTPLEDLVHANLCEVGRPEPILDKPEPCWSQGDRTYGKKNRRFKR